MGRELQWAILGTGSIANEMADAFAGAGRSIYAVSNRTLAKAEAFAEKYKVEKVYEDFHGMLADPKVDIVYISTPHNMHIGYVLEALEQGKHVLCEKSITLNSAELRKASALAKEKGLVLAEAMTIYHMPLYKKLRGIVESGALGKVRMIQLNFGSFKEYDMANRFFNKALAGGALLDIGVYAISFARFFLDEKPDQILSQVRYAPSGADEQSGILMMNKHGQMVTISLTLHAKQPKRGIVACDGGYIEITEYPRADEATIVHTATKERETVRAGEQAKALAYEMEDMERAVRGEGDEMLLGYTTDVMELMTKLRVDWGMYYDSESEGGIL